MYLNQLYFFCGTFIQIPLVKLLDHAGIPGARLAFRNVSFFVCLATEELQLISWNFALNYISLQGIAVSCNEVKC